MTVNPDNRITAEAARALAKWALKQEKPLPPLSMIGACDRLLWWADQILGFEPDDEEVTP